MRDDRAIPRWTKIGIVALEVLSVAGLVVVSIFSGQIIDRLGTTTVIIGGVVGTAILIGVAYLVFDRPRKRRP